ncbi:phosphotransferase family protein [Streptomyces regalis]|uniref:Aminoglycoside phosphotransferase n=1 Tax=Streptomyces regalis TaxID=68262 RepID=A0A0X3V6X7_9ACTN|nr:aminoglycoside phosphotransferase family protein [Streptomyces regalis]KUL40490.1 aminoglycoside phosphotransferase [Streptomyces regalis]
MTTPSVSDDRQPTHELSVDPRLVRGPLKGYHHVTHVLLADRTWIKCREPRAEILWFDRRCFKSEEELLRVLKKHDIACVPDVVAIGGTDFQGFIEGRTVGARRWWSSRSVSDAIFDQLVDVFREMVRIRPHMLQAERRCEPEDRPEDGDTDGFLERLIVFMEEQVYERNRPQFEGLFRELGVADESFTRLRKAVSGLTSRPFCLLHADLHRKNLIVDPRGRLWVIDWELAMVGDPLYDLATHLYLMRYPAWQENRMTQEWCRVVERVHPGSSRGWEVDLSRILEFKRAQSVFTDVIRVALKLREQAEFSWVGLPAAAARLQRILTAAAEPLGLENVPAHKQIMAALVRWHRESDTVVMNASDAS